MQLKQLNVLTSILVLLFPMINAFSNQVRVQQIPPLTTNVNGHNRQSYRLPQNGAVNSLPIAKRYETSLFIKNEGDDGELENKGESFQWIFSLWLPLWLAYVSNQWSRSSIYYLVDFSDQANAFKSINIDLNFSQGQYGLLASVAFTSLFAIASLGAGIASDRFNRKTLTIASIVAWSTATLFTGLSDSYENVVLWRVAMGLACAFSTPTAYTLLTQKVPKERGALAASLYSTGVALGGALASLSILLDTQIGWRDTLFAISAFGFVSAGANAVLLSDDPKEEMTTAKEVVATTEDDRDESSIFAEIGEIVSTSRVKWLFLGSFLRFCSGLCIGVWSAPLFRESFPDYSGDYAVAQAAITAVCGVSSGLIGGVIADKISESNDAADVGLKLWVPVLGSVLAIPTWYFAIHEGSFGGAMGFLAAEYFVAECWFGPTVNVLQSTVGPKVGGTAQGLFTVTGAVGNLAPTALGFLYDAGSNGDLSDLLTTFVCGGYLLSATCFAASALSLPEEETPAL